jgi:hypothetical protein
MRDVEVGAACGRASVSAVASGDARRLSQPPCSLRAVHHVPMLPAGLAVRAARLGAASLETVE